VIALVLGLACQPPDIDPIVDLSPYANPMTSADPLFAPQPHRDNPLELAIDGRGRAWVSMQGSPDEPGNTIASVDLSTGDIARYYTGGSSPTGLAMHPDGRWLVVFNRFSDAATVFDTELDAIAGYLRTDFYATEGAFTPDGKSLWVTNRWRDAVAIWDLVEVSAGLNLAGEEHIPVDTNPRDIALSPDGSLMAVATLTGGSVSILDVQAREELFRIDLMAPANGLAWVDDFVIVATTSASTHHLPLEGPDGNDDGIPGDGTPNVNFQDLQNELAVIHGPTGELRHRYTSDSICCEDYRDVDPVDEDRLGGLLPPQETWIVGGALPEQVVAHEDGVWVDYSGSNELQRFAVDSDTGELTPETPVATSGHNPHGMAIFGDRLLVAHRLSETLGEYDANAGTHLVDYQVGDITGGRFPATDAEIGELFNQVTAPFTVDGDQSCTHCHREGGNIDKAFSMPLTAYAGLGSRMTMAYRGAYDTRPWFFESAFDHTNFKPVMNEFARIENFCCSDYTLWPNGAPADCEQNPPPECGLDGPGSRDGFAAHRDDDVLSHARPTDFATRDSFYLAQAERVIGRSMSFGDSVYFENPITEERSASKLDFDGITRALGVFLLTDTNLLPNPNPQNSDEVNLGRALFERPDTGCATCHAGPGFSVATDHNPFNVPVRMAPVVTPNRADDGTNLDLFAGGFVDTFPLSQQESCEDVCGADLCDIDNAVCDDLREVRFGSPPLRGIWDRAPSMLHDGRAQGLREVLATPGHPALGQGQVGFNVRDGVVDSHGGTSHLTAAELEALIAFLESL
jgi:6-phosphogluconolactonase (cycloisomerase 2 family)